MTNPPTGSMPPAGDPNQYQAQPPQYGDPQEGGPQQGGPQYGAPQYGAPQYGGQQPGFPVAPQAYGSAPIGLNRPGSATAAGVLGIIFTAIGFLSGALSVVVLTGAMEASAFAVIGAHGFPLALSIIAAVILVVAAVIGFIGAIQLLSGKSNQLLLMGTYIFVGSRVLSLIASLMITSGSGAGSQVVSALIGIVLAGVLITFARNGDVVRWLERKKAASAAGHY